MSWWNGEDDPYADKIPDEWKEHMRSGTYDEEVGDIVDVERKIGLEDSDENYAMIRDQLGYAPDPYSALMLGDQVYLDPDTGLQVEGFAGPVETPQALPSVLSIHIEAVFP